jgi:transcriptional regulator with XRE-family HTH domain
VREDGDLRNFGVILRRYRWGAGLTQEELARQSGLSVRAVSDIERGHTSRPYARTIRLLADALELDEPARARLMSAAHDGTDEAPGERHEEIARSPEDPAPTVPAPTVPAPTVSASTVSAPTISAPTFAAVADGVGSGSEAAPAPAPAAPASRDNRSWQYPRLPGWAQLAAASAAAALAGGVAGWGMVNHAPASQSPPVSISTPKPPSGLLPSIPGSAARALAQCEQGSVDLTSSLVHGTHGTFWGTMEVLYSYRCASVWTRFDPSPAVSDTKAVMVTIKIIGLPDRQDQVSSASGTDATQSTKMLMLRNGCAQGSVILLKLGMELASATTACQAPPSP